MYKEVWPFNLVDLDNTNITIPQLPTSKNKRCIVYFDGPCEVKAKNKILVVPFWDCGLYTPDIVLIEKEMLLFAKENNISAGEDNCIHLIKTMKNSVYHGFAMI